MRIASLVPSATEMLFALGLGDSVVAVTHECDHPAQARSLPHLTRMVLADGLAEAVANHPVAGAKMAEGQLTRYGNHDDIAGLATYLASDQSGFINGAELRIDGGWTATARFPNLVELVLADMSAQ